MSICLVTGKEHKWEWSGMSQGEEWERCADCGEVRLAGYHDLGSGA
jgi:hypothetical protein